VGGNQGCRAGDQPAAWPHPTTWLGWLPVASLVLGSSGAATAVNSAWVTMSEMPKQDSLGDGWLDAIVPQEREDFGASMRRAAASGESGTAGCHLARPAGWRWSRWWWQPAPVGGLVCVAVIDDGQTGIVAGSGMNVDLASAVIHRVFGIGLALESAAGLADGPAAARLRYATDQLDDLIRDIRTMVFGARQLPQKGDS
jgi:hypothetical protein